MRRVRVGPALRSLLILAAAAPVGCGYTTGYGTPPGAETVAVPIFHNSTFALRRDLEFELTSLVRRELQARTSLRLVDSGHADLVVRGNIVEFAEERVVEARRNEKIESNVRAVVDLVVEDYVNGYRRVLRVRDDQPFSPVSGETFEQGRRRALENLAERIVARIEYWDDYDEIEGDGSEDGTASAAIDRAAIDRADASAAGVASVAGEAGVERPAHRNEDEDEDGNGNDAAARQAVEVPSVDR